MRRLVAMLVATAWLSGGLLVTSVPSALASSGGYPWASATCQGSPLTYHGVQFCPGDSWVYKGGLYDTWGYSYRNCTSWVAWRLATNNGYTMPRAIGDASAWGTYFASHGHAPNNTPAVGAIAWEPNGDHVAYVESVSGSQVTISEYNEAYYPGQPTTGDGLYDTRTVPSADFEYIHVKDLGGGGNPLTITTTSLPNGEISQNYSASLRASGGTPPYTWSVSSGNLPAGLSLSSSGTLSGIPTGGPETTAFGVTVRDAVGERATATLTIFVPDLCPTVASNGYADGCPREVGKLVGDFTGDGKLDVAAFYRETASTTDVFVFPGNGNGTFRSPVLAASLVDWNSADTRIAGVGDFTDNGNESIAVFYYEGNNITDLFVLPGNGSGTFGNPILASSQTAWSLSHTLTVGVGDFTGHGQQDIAVFYGEDNNTTDLFIFPGNGNGTFGNPIVGATLTAWDVANTMPAGVGDFTGSGHLGVAAFYNEGGNVTDLFVLPGNGNGTFGSPIVGSTQPQWTTPDTLPAGVGDFNHNGKLDIAAFYNEGGNVSDLFVFEGNGNGTFSGPAVGVTETAWNLLDTTSAGSGDFTGDGNPDVAVFYGEGTSTTDLFVLPGEGNGTFGNVIVGSSQPAWSQLDTLTW